MFIQTLNGYWQVRQSSFEDWLPACVPGGVHTDLMAAGRIPDPFYGENEKAAAWVAEKDWVYRRFFHPNPALLSHERISLVCEGLDTRAEVRLNGRILGAVDNAFRRWEWEVHHLLRAGENVLEITFRSPMTYIRGRERLKPMGDLSMAVRGGPHLRKPPSHFGWDWGPVLPCIGIWKEVRLEGQSTVSIVDVRFEQIHEHMHDPSESQVTLTAYVQAEWWGERGRPLVLHMRATAPDGSVRRAKMPLPPTGTRAVLPLKIYKPQLWWPNGLGAQALYQVDIEVLDGDPGAEGTRVLASRSYSIGLREIELRQQNDAWGQSFTFAVNGVPVFCKGSNWIPADSFPSRVDAAKLERLVRAAAESNQNMLRVWGGGYYEDDYFYGLCDRYGILVWQDFMFACATYPLDDPVFVDSVRCEVIDAVKRLRHHACLALWCGNNEIEVFFPIWRRLKKPAALFEAYERFFYNALPELLSVEDPGRPYWPSSPSSNDLSVKAGAEDTGDAHLWEVYHSYKQPVYYREQNPRFTSEFGFQSLPDLETVAAFTPPESTQAASDLNRAVLRSRQRAMGGNAKLIWYLAQRFRLPRRFSDLVYLSQVFQAEAMRTAVEHWRRQPARTSGALYWQLNDCWPAISWSSIDYYGRWKALHYAARRFFAPQLLSVEDITARGQRKMNIWLSNDHPIDWQGHLHWTLETLDGRVLEGGDQAVTARPLSAQCVLNKDFAAARQDGRKKIDWSRTVFVTELWSAPANQGGQRLAMQVTPFVVEKRMTLPAPGLDWTLSEDEGGLRVEVSARRLARFVNLKLDGADVVFSDNYFDLPAGRSVSVTSPLPDGWTIEQAQAALRVRSLADVRPSESILAGRWKTAGALVSSLWEMLKVLRR